jgi:hypothetical protein
VHHQLNAGVGLAADDRPRPQNKAHGISSEMAGEWKQWRSGHWCVAEQLVRTREASDWVPFKRRLRLTSGP